MTIIYISQHMKLSRLALHFDGRSQNSQAFKDVSWIVHLSHTFKALEMADHCPKLSKDLQKLQEPCQYWSLSIFPVLFWQISHAKGVWSLPLFFQYLLNKFDMQRQFQVCLYFSNTSLTDFTCKGGLKFASIFLVPL